MLVQESFLEIQLMYSNCEIRPQVDLKKPPTKERFSDRTGINLKYIIATLPIHPLPTPFAFIGTAPIALLSLYWRQFIFTFQPL